MATKKKTAPVCQSCPPVSPIVPVDMFSTAQVVAIKPVSTGKKADSEPDGIKLGQELDLYVAIDALTKSLAGVQKTCRAEIETAVEAEFVKRSATSKTKPESFHGLSDLGDVTCAWSKRASNIPLNEDEQKLLASYKIPVESTELSERIPERYFFNPDLLVDASLSGKISAALASIPELAGKQVIMKQAERPAQMKVVVSDATVEAVAKLGKREAIADLFHVVGKIMLKAKCKSQDLNDILEVIRKAGVKI